MKTNLVAITLFVVSVISVAKADSLDKSRKAWKAFKEANCTTLTPATFTITQKLDKSDYMISLPQGYPSEKMAILVSHTLKFSSGGYVTALVYVKKNGERSLVNQQGFKKKFNVLEEDNTCKRLGKAGEATGNNALRLVYGSGCSTQQGASSPFCPKL